MNHEKLECYRLLAAIAEEIARRVSRWPKGNAYLIDQIKRAIASSVLNLAEGNGKGRFGRERHQFFRIALGSIAEVAACLDLAGNFGLIQSCAQESLKSRLRLAYVQIRGLP
jgi:four helix bundle protein